MLRVLTLCLAVGCASADAPACPGEREGGCGADAVASVQVGAAVALRRSRPKDYAYASVAFIGGGPPEQQASRTTLFHRRVAQTAKRLATSRASYPYVVLTNRPGTFGDLAAPHVLIRRLNETLEVPCDVPVLMYTGRWVSTWTSAYQKMQVFGLEEFSKVLFLDLDVKIQGNLDHIFELPLPGGGVAMQRNDDICLGTDFDRYMDVPVAGEGSASRPGDLLTGTGYARAVQRLFDAYLRAGPQGRLLLGAEHGRVAQQRISRSPRDTWNKGLNSGIMLLAPNLTDLREMQRVERFLPHDCAEWWPDGADQVVISSYFHLSSRARALRAGDASYSHCAFIYAASGYLPEGRTIRALHATCEKYFPELIGLMQTLTAMGVPRTAHGLLWARRKAAAVWGKAVRLRRRVTKPG